LAHRIIWAINYDIPPELIDHVDGNRANNRLSNLRSVTHRENGMNKVIPNTNTSGYIGVYWEVSLKKWRSQLNVRGKCIKLGCFDKLEDAVSARKFAAIEHGFHPNHGKPSV